MLLHCSQDTEEGQKHNVLIRQVLTTLADRNRASNDLHASPYLKLLQHRDATACSDEACNNRQACAAFR